MIRAFVHDQAPVRLRFGPGTLQHLEAELERLGIRRALLIHGGSQSVAAAGLRELLGARLTGSISEARRHVPAQLAARARDEAEASGTDGLVALGGGSAIGLAKAVTLSLRLPIVALPTTYSGSEMTPIYGFTDAGRKRTGRDEAVRPRTVIYDPQLSRSLPPATSAASALNALAHCIDALWAPAANPLTTLLAEAATRELRVGLETMLAAPDDLGGRGRLLYGAALAGWALGVAGTALHHKICHAVGGAFDLPHAEAHAVVLPHSTAFSVPSAPESAARLAAALGVDDLAAGVYDLVQRCGLPTSLRELGLREEDLDTATAAVVAEVAGTPGRPPEPALRALLERAWAGARPTLVPRRGT